MSRETRIPVWQLTQEQAAAIVLWIVLWNIWVVESIRSTISICFVRECRVDLSLLAPYGACECASALLIVKQYAYALLIPFVIAYVPMVALLLAQRYLQRRRNRQERPPARAGRAANRR